MKFCPNCGTSTQETDVRKCDVCGYSWLTGEDLCPNCGHNSQSKETFSVHDLMDKLSKIDNENLVLTFSDKIYQKLRGKNISKKDEIKVNLIKFYPLPKTKNALYEFIVFSNANSKISNAGNANDIQSQTIIANAWKAKLEQSYHFALLKYGNDADFLEIKRMYIERKRKDILSIVIPIVIAIGGFFLLFSFGLTIGILSELGLISG